MSRTGSKIVNEDFRAVLEAAVSSLPSDLRSLAEPAIEALRQATELSIERISHVLEDETADLDLRTAAAWAIGLAKDSRPREVLKRLAQNSLEQRLVWEATKALCSLEGEEGFFRSLLDTGATLEHRRAAVYALGAIADLSALGQLTEMLLSPAEPASIRAQAAESLGYLRDRRAVEPLIQATADSSPEVRFSAVFALGAIGDPSAQQTLEEITRSDNGVVEDWGKVADEALGALESLKRALEEGQ